MTASSLDSTPDRNYSAKEERKLRKPLIEKKRRERINNSLDQLKCIMVDAYNLDQSKLEKADVLEITVQHMESLQRNNVLAGGQHGLEAQQRYSSGYIQCMHEVHNLLLNCQGMDKKVGARLLNHLLKSLPQISSDVATAPSMASPKVLSPSHPAASIYPQMTVSRVHDGHPGGLLQGVQLPNTQMSPPVQCRTDVDRARSVENLSSPPGSPEHGHRNSPVHHQLQSFLGSDSSMWRPW
ncbi:hairy-related 8a [Erpetoichthys calabaricus]|uniref:Hairy-related 8a n=1 Tax=Erpetoichthys calabaricus TaxID=27687 RepID=A0A8C4SAC8_ERPCA|nr:hairy-related 8a [Erpetoichthys calabaricus]